MTSKNLSPWNPTTATLLPCPKCGDGGRQLSDDNYTSWLHAVCDGCGYTEPGDIAIEDAEDAQLEAAPLECLYCRAPVPSGQTFCATCLSHDPTAQRSFDNEQHELQCQFYHDTLEGGESC